MLRLFRFRKNVVSLGTRIHTAQYSQPAVVRMQRVRFQKKRPKLSTILVSAGVSYALYEILTRTLEVSVVEEDEDEDEDEEEGEEEMTDEERKKHEAYMAYMRAPLFIPFPGFTQMIEPQPYRGSDPEWLAYVRVSKNAALLVKIRRSLAEMTRRAIAAYPQPVVRGLKDATISKYWLDIYYPYKPPPVFVRQGLSIGENGITWSKRYVDSLAVFWTREALWPSVLTSSIWSFTSALMTQNATAVAKFLGFESGTQPLPDMQQTIGRIQQQFGARPGKSGSASPSTSSPDRMGSGATSGSLPQVDKRSVGSTTTPEAMGPGSNVGNTVPTATSVKDMYLVRTAQEHTSGPWDKFKQTFTQKWRGAPSFPPRGSILVTGIVELETPRHVLSIDCSSWWDPRTEKFDPKTTKMQLRIIRAKVQSPLR